MRDSGPAPPTPGSEPIESSASWRKRLGNHLWGAREVLRRGRPGVTLMIRGGIGDQLLLSTAARELRRRGRRRVWVMSSYPDLFRLNRDVDQVVDEGIAYATLTRRLGGRMGRLTYAEYVPEEDRHIPPDRHIIARMCALAGMTGEVELRPYLVLDESEQRRGRLADRQIAVMSSGLAARSAMANKEWGLERFQEVVDHLSGAFRVVQLGAAGDPPLRGVLDLRGQPFRESAAVLAHSRVFIGQEGFLMHLARAVECPSVVVYGGRVHPSQTGYGCNENLYTPVPCAPCWRLSSCDRDRECLTAITPARVLAAVDRQLEGWPTPGEARRLPVDKVRLGTEEQLPEEQGTGEPRGAAG